jgi:ribosome-associated protein
MKNDVPVKNGIVIPGYELEITTSRAGGPGGQHVNKTDTRITVRWNVKNTSALSEEQKERVMQNLQARLTSDGDLIIHNSASRSQQQNRENALEQLAIAVRKGLYVPKKRMATRVSKAAKEARLQSKTARSTIKKMRSKKNYDD